MDVDKLFTKAEDAIKRENYDFAVEILKNQILQFNPDNVKARKLLRSTVIKKYEKSGYPSQGQKLKKGMLCRIKMIVGKLSKKWDKVVEEAENYLLLDPKNTSVLSILGDACLHAGYVDTAISIFESILSFDKNHVQAIKSLGRIYKDHKEDFERANQYFQRAKRIAPQDGEVEKIVKDLAAQMTATQYGQAKSSSDLLKDKEKSKELEENQKILRTDEDVLRAIERAKKKLEEDPNNKRELTQLGDYYQRLSRWDEAVEAYMQVSKLDPTNFDVILRMGECRIARQAHRLNEINEKLKTAGGDQAARLKQERQKVMKEKLDTEVKEYTAQVERQPTNYALRMKLGMSLFHAARYDESIANFQQAIKDPKNKIMSYIYMGQAFTKKQEYGLAEQQFQMALDSVSAQDKQRKDILYHLGITYEANKKFQQAIDAFTEIYTVDINFKDVQERLKKVREML